MTNLIGLSGKISSGKDTAALILQRLFKYHYSTIVGYNIDDDGICIDYSNWKIKRFAGKLKEIASLLTGIPKEKFEDQEFKKTILGEEWGCMTVREFLQRIGTDAMRDNVHSNIWINALFSDFKPYQTSYEQGVVIRLQPNFLVPDVRFCNEFDEIKKRGGKVIYIERGDGNTGTHPSEVEMESFKDKCDFHINNNGSYEDLEQRLGLFLSMNNMLPSSKVYL